MAIARYQGIDTDLSEQALGLIRVYAEGRSVVILSEDTGAATVAAAQPTARVCVYPRSGEGWGKCLDAMVRHDLRLVSDRSNGPIGEVILNRWRTLKDDEQTHRRGTYTQVRACIHLDREPFPPPGIYELAIVLDGDTRSLAWAAGACNRARNTVLWRGPENIARAQLGLRGFILSARVAELEVWTK